MGPVEVGFVFALRREAAEIVDMLKQKTTFQDAGHLYHSGLWNQHRVAVAVAGVGQVNAARATEILYETFQPHRIISAGYAGGLCPKLQAFQVIFPTQIVRVSDGKRMDVATARTDRTSARTTNHKLATADFVAVTLRQKSELWQKTGADIVDMETFAVAAFCHEKNVPFYPIRIVLDQADEELPQDVVNILTSAEKCGLKLASCLMGSLLRRPKLLWDLLSLKKQAVQASDLLTRQLAITLETRNRPVP